MANKNAPEAPDAVGEPTPAPAAAAPAAKAEEPHVPDDQRYADYRFTMPASRRKDVKQMFPPRNLVVSFSRPKQESQVVNTSAAVAQQLATEGWKVEKV